MQLYEQRNNHSLRELLLHDVNMDDVKACIKLPGEDEDSFKRAVNVINFVSLIVRSCAMCGGSTGSAMLEIALPEPLSILGNSTASVESRSMSALIIYSCLRDYNKDSSKEGILPRETIQNIFFGILGAQDDMHHISISSTQAYWSDGEFAWSSDRNAYGITTLFICHIFSVRSLLVTPVMLDCLSMDDAKQALSFLVCFALLDMELANAIALKAIQDIASQGGSVHLEMVHYAIDLVFEKLVNLGAKARNMAFEVILSLCSHGPAIVLSVLEKIYNLLVDNSRDSHLIDELVRACINLENAIGNSRPLDPVEEKILQMLLNFKVLDPTMKIQFQSSSMELTFKFCQRASLSTQQLFCAKATVLLMEALSNKCRSQQDSLQLHVASGIIIGLDASVIHNLVQNQEFIRACCEASTGNDGPADILALLLSSLWNKAGWLLFTL